MNRWIIALFVLIFDQGKLCRQASSKGIICLRGSISFGICLYKEPAFCIIGGKKSTAFAIGSNLFARKGGSAGVIKVVFFGRPHFFRFQKLAKSIVTVSVTLP